MKKLEITGMVLAGGRSSRMGIDKSLLVWKGKTLVEHAINALKPLCSKVIISSNNPVYHFTGCEIWPDELPQQAPIIGIYSCLKRSGTDMNIILSCDMPYIETGLLRYLIESSDNHHIVVPVHDDGLIEPLCGIYNKTVITQLEHYIKSNDLSLYKFLQECPHQFIMINNELPFYRNNMFVNINTPEDLKNLLDQP
jgi:molybdopterin-guanine dinucleotide biosynthesis protein A